MALYFIKDSIVNISADAVVNSANPKVYVGGGVDNAIYKAAGRKELFQARVMIGEIPEGEARYTDAYNLKAKYIIHTVAPIWKDGENDEERLLRSCYKKSLELIKKLGCKSAVFPLLATGINGFPKDLALRIAVTTIQDFLIRDADNYDISLAIIDDEVLRLSKKITNSIIDIISDEDIKIRLDDEYRNSRKKPKKSEFVLDKDTIERISHMIITGEFPKFKNENEAVNAAIKPFNEYLLSIIDSHPDINICKEIGVNRNMIYYLNTKKGYHPKKENIIATAIVMGMNLDETVDLLAYAGYSLAIDSIRDRLIIYCIQNKMDLKKTDELLIKYKCEPLKKQGIE